MNRRILKKRGIRMSPKGFHFIVEASGCNSAISQVDKLQEILVEAAKRANTQVWSVSFHKFPPDGVSGVVVISESHLSVHSWPEENSSATDIYTCDLVTIGSYLLGATSSCADQCLCGCET